MDSEQAAALRAPFPPELVGKLPGTSKRPPLDYVGHAAVTDRLIAVDPCWYWEPLAFTDSGLPHWTVDGNTAVMWIRLTVCDVTRLGVGMESVDATDLEKKLISDALRNAAMRFGVALDLWSKEDLSGGVEDAGHRDDPASSAGSRARTAKSPPGGPSGSGTSHDQLSANQLNKLKTRAAALVAANVSVADARAVRNLPPIDKSTVDELAEWASLLDDLETTLPPL